MKQRSLIAIGCTAMLVFVVVFVLLVKSVYTTHTPYGECLGLGETQVDSLVYEVDVENVVLGVIFVETIIAPAYIVLKDLYCPTGVKQ